MKKWGALVLVVVLVLLGFYVYDAKANTVVFDGSSTLWSGRLIFDQQKDDVEKILTLEYKGPSPEKIGTVNISYSDPYGNYTAEKKLHPKTNQINLVSEDKLPIPDKNAVISVKLSWNGDEQEFTLKSK